MLLFWRILTDSAPVVHLSVAQITQHLDILHLFATQSNVGQVMDIELVAIFLTLPTLLTRPTGPLECFGSNVLPSLRAHVLATIVAPCFVNLLAGRSDGLEKAVCA